jgi:hypothetical protein
MCQGPVVPSAGVTLVLGGKVFAVSMASSVFRFA